MSVDAHPHGSTRPVQDPPLPSEEQTKGRVLVIVGLRRTIECWGWYPLALDGRMVASEFMYRRKPSDIIVLHAFDNPGHFFEECKGPKGWDQENHGRIIVFYDALRIDECYRKTAMEGYGITLELFLEQK